MSITRSISLPISNIELKLVEVTGARIRSTSLPISNIELKLVVAGLKHASSISLPISNIELKPDNRMELVKLVYQFTYIQH